MIAKDPRPRKRGTYTIHGRTEEEEFFIRIGEMSITSYQHWLMRPADRGAGKGPGLTRNRCAPLNLKHFYARVRYSDVHLPVDYV
jgi:hypothetical protein